MACSDATSEATTDTSNAPPLILHPFTPYIKAKFRVSSPGDPEQL